MLLMGGVDLSMALRSCGFTPFSVSFQEGSEREGYCCATERWENMMGGGCFGSDGNEPLLLKVER